MSRRPLILILLCANLPVMMAALLSPGFPDLQQAFKGEAEIQLLSKLVIMTPALAIACSAGFIGILVDRWGRFPILLMSLLLFGLFGVQGYWADDIYALIVTRFIFGVGVAGIMTTTSAALAERYSGSDLRRMVALQAGVMGLWGITFQVIAGYLAEEVSWRAPFLLYATAFPLVFLLIFERTRPQEASETEIVEAPASPPRAAILILGLLMLSAAVSSLFALLPVQGPLFFHELGFSPKRTAFLLSTQTAASCSASLLLAMWRRHVSSELALLAGLFSLTVSFALLGHADRWRDLGLSMVGIGGGVGLVIPCVSALIGTLTPPGRKGKILGALLTVNYIGQFVSPFWSQSILRGSNNNGLFLYGSGIAGTLAALVLCVTLFTLERKPRRG